jgi:hypothetical protein
MKIDQIISLCCKQDAVTWSIANKAIIKYIPAKQYTVIVPDTDVLLFEEISDQKFIVMSESIFSKKFQKYISDRLPSLEHGHISWYLQQFIKLELLNQLNENTNAVLWDGDTVPLEPIDFIDDDGKLRYFVGTENHQPYFATIKKLFNIDKQVSHSFISQSFPIKSEWFQEFKREIENRSGKIWYEVIIDAINFSHSNAFSEYETLGNFIANQYSNEISFSDDPWLRLGNSLIGDIRLINSSSAQEKLAPYKYVSFEKWDRAKPTFFKVTLPLLYQKIIKPSLNKALKNRSINHFYKKLLRRSGTLKIDSGVGIFSCCTVRLESILEYYNLHHKIPKLVDSSDQFVFYKENDDENISRDLFAERNDVDIQWGKKPIKVTASSDEQQFSNYQEICYEDVTPFIQKYFSPSELITSTVAQLQRSSRIDYDNTCVIRFRGTDKEEETVQPKFEEVLNKALEIQAKNPLIRFAVQTDDPEFRKFIYHSLGERCFEVESTSWEGWSGNKDYIDFYSCIYLLSKCKYIITTSGNGELWMMLFRGHSEGIIQYLEHKEVVYGIPNKSFKPGKISHWIEK